MARPLRRSKAHAFVRNYVKIKSECSNSSSIRPDIVLQAYRGRKPTSDLLHEFVDPADFRAPLASGV